MVKITNGINVFEVTTGAYDGIYRHQGYQIIGEQAPQEFVSADDSEVKKTADEIFVDELQEKPISQWSKDEVKRFAAIKGIDLAGTKNVVEAKEVIKIAMGKEGEE